MKNKFKKSLLAIGAAILSCGALVGCDSNSGDDNVLKIVVLNAGYGDAWINELETKFEAEHEGIDVKIEALYDAGQLIQSHLESRKNTDDLYISVGAEWKTYAAQGKFANLDDLLEEEVDDTTVKNKVADEYQDSLYFTKSDGTAHCYRLPWTSGIGGIYYNKVMFKEHGWDIYLKEKYSTNTTGLPETFEQLLDLCNKIVDDKIPVSNDRKTAVKPFAYTGANTDYFDYTVFDWWAQIVGKEAIKDFLKYESYENYDISKNQTYAALKTATEYWSKLFVEFNDDGTAVGESKFVKEDSESKTAEAAQKEFVNGYAAMMFNGDWLYNEIINYGISTTKFELGLMKTPTIPESKSEYVNTSYVIGEDQYIAIPESSKHKSLAKEFIKLMISNEGSITFTKNANGFLAYNTDFTNSGITNEFINETIELRESYTTKYTSYSDNRKYLCNYIDIWSTAGNRPYLALLNGTRSLDASFATISSTAKANWADWTNKSK